MARRLSKFLLAAACGGSGLIYLNGFRNKENQQKGATQWTSKLKAICSTEESITCSQWDWNWDKRSHLSQEEVDKPGRSLKHYIFIRHGQYNIDGFNDSERQLTQLGREQAEMTGKRLAELNLGYNRIVQSSMTRAKETCGIVSKYLKDLPPVETSDLLREGSPIPPDPPNRSNEPELKYFADAPRIESAFRKYVYRPKIGPSPKESVEVYVCHANVIRYFLCRVAQFPPQGWLRMSLKHGSITWITVYSDGDVFIRCIGDAGYMPRSKLSS